MGIFDKIVSKVKSVVSPKLLDPRADKPETPLNFDISNTKMPDGSTTNPSTVTGYNWARKYFPEANAPRLTKDSFGKVVPEIEKKIASPTLIPSNMKNVGVATTMTPKVMGIGTTKKQEKVYTDFYDGAEIAANAFGIPKEAILANSRWEHRGNPNWEKGIYGENVWNDPVRNKAESSYGPGQINMLVYGPEAYEKHLSNITPNDPLYITKEDASDPYKAAQWMAKNFKMQIDRAKRKGLEPDWEAIFQSYNPYETDRGKNVKNLIDTTDFVRS